MATTGQPDRFEFGPFRLDCRTRELWRDEELVHLSPTAFDLLRALVSSADRLVQKSELLKGVWPDSFVSEDSLTHYIAALRKTLDDNPERPQYILTVPRHGYRFIAAVRRVSDEPMAEQQPEAAPATSGTFSTPSPVAARDTSMAAGALTDIAPPKRLLSALGWVAVCFAGLLAATAAAIVVRQRPEPEAPLTQFTIAAPEGTAFSPSASFPAVSPDGRHVAFVAGRRGDATRLWVRSLDSLTSRELAGTDGALAPFWSPDSRSVGFVAGGVLKTVSLMGGPPTILTNVQPGVAPSGTWNADGVILFSQGNALFSIPASGGAPAQVTTVDVARGETAHLLPHFLPDGRRFLYLARGNAGKFATSWILVGSLDSQDRRRLIQATSQGLYVEPGYVVFLRGGTLHAQPFDPERLALQGEALAVNVADHVGFNPATPRGMFSVSRSGALAYRPIADRELGWFDRAGTPLGWIGDGARDSDPALSPDGRRVAVSRYAPATLNRDIWILDAERGGVATQVTSLHPWAICPIWSADGTRVVFASGGGRGGGQLFERHMSDQGGPRVLLDKVIGCPIDWTSQDHLLYSERASGGTALWSVRPGDDEGPKPVGIIVRDREFARVSPDGRWIAYVSDSSGRSEIYIRSYPVTSAGPWKVSSNGGIEPQWRRDGRELYYLAADKRLMAVPVSVDGDFRAEAPVPLFETDLDPNGLGISGRNQYVAAASGQRFLLNQTRPNAEPPSVTVVLNWTTGLRLK